MDVTYCNSQGNFPATWWSCEGQETDQWIDLSTTSGTDYTVIIEFKKDMTFNYCVGVALLTYLQDTRSPLTRPGHVQKIKK